MRTFSILLSVVVFAGLCAAICYADPPFASGAKPASAGDASSWAAAGGGKELPDLSTSASLAAALEYAFRWNERNRGFAATAADCPLDAAARNAAPMNEGLSRSMKYRVRSRIIRAYSDLALNDEMLTLTSDTREVLYEMRAALDSRFVRAMDDCSYASLAKMDIEIIKAESEMQSYHISREYLTARLNRYLWRAPDARVGAVCFPEIRRLPFSTEEVYARAHQGNRQWGTGGPLPMAPAMARPGGFAFAAAGGGDGAGTGAGAAMTTAPADWRLGLSVCGEAPGDCEMMDVGLIAAAAIAGLRNSERIQSDYGRRIIPKAREALQTEQDALQCGNGDLLEVLNARKMLIAYRKTVVKAQAERFQRLAEIEAIAEADLFLIFDSPYAPADESLKMNREFVTSQ